MTEQIEELNQTIQHLSDLIQSGQDNTFKIGVTRGSIEKRIKKLQTGNSEEIFLVNYYETDIELLI